MVEPETIKKVNNMFLEDRKIKLQVTADTFMIRIFYVFDILQGHLSLRNLFSNWLRTLNQKQ